jgi:hypothetical protein
MTRSTSTTRLTEEPPATGKVEPPTTGHWMGLRVLGCPEAVISDSGRARWLVGILTSGLSQFTQRIDSIGGVLGVLAKRI